MYKIFVLMSFTILSKEKRRRLYAGYHDLGITILSALRDRVSMREKNNALQMITKVTLIDRLVFIIDKN